MQVTPLNLVGPRVTLRPLTSLDVPALFAVGRDQDLWRLTTTRIQSESEMAMYVSDALSEQEKGFCLPFVTTVGKTGEVVGSTRFAAISKPHRRLEIGWTWIAKSWQRTFVNTEAKFLMLQHAFEALGANRVEFKTSHENLRSQTAIARLGATQEGILRNHMVNPSGTLRHSVYFSIIKEEWAAVKERLRQRLEST